MSDRNFDKYAQPLSSFSHDLYSNVEMGVKRQLTTRRTTLSFGADQRAELQLTSASESKLCALTAKGQDAARQRKTLVVYSYKSHDQKKRLRGANVPHCINNKLKRAGGGDKKRPEPFAHADFSES
jgi:hypothetical protein